MTTKTDDIKLPELPLPNAFDPGRYGIIFSPEQMEAYGQECARAAVEADRQGRMPSDDTDLLHYAMAIAHERELRVTGHPHDEDGTVRRFRAAVSRYGKPAASAEPIYQVFHTDGTWEDLDADSYANSEDAGREVRIVYAAPVAQEPVADAATTLAAICDLFGIGIAARDPGTILANVKNVVRRSACLRAVERHLTVSTPPDPDEGDDEPGEECLLRWGADPEGYAKHFLSALKEFGYTLVTPTVAPVAAQAQTQAQQDCAPMGFKNFHRLLCERFGYCHDERDWKRDQISLIEHIAKQVSAQDREDAERMDWLDRVAHCADWLEGEPTKRVIRASDGAEFTGDTWREAIDAARAAKGADHG